MIKVLFLAADPDEERARLRLDEEVRAIDAAIQRGPHRDTLQFISHFAVRTRDLQAVLLRHEPQIVHFAGHGDGSGGIVLGSEGGGYREVDREALNALFAALEHPPRVVVVNACDTPAAGAGADSVVDYTIGMNSPIEDTSALLFAEAFYGALAAGQTVARAFKLGVVQLRLEGTADAKLPALHVRPGVDPEVALVENPDERGGKDAEPEIVIENSMNSGNAGSAGKQVQSHRDPATGRIITYRNG